ncbi:MAG: YlmC/YmxH family sporulation protein [Firmicutes bacterium]|nr:YlmC/YmxH family sporulation protein [Bacillota bacterium]
MSHELSFCELRQKQVINVIDGKVLGRICDVVFSRQSARVLGFVVPGESGFSLFKRKGDVFIPFERICKIGCDVVLVELKPLNPHVHGELVEINHHNSSSHKSHGGGGHNSPKRPPAKPNCTIPRD